MSLPALSRMRRCAPALLAMALCAGAPAAWPEEFAPYGSAETALQAYPAMDLVFDVNYRDPNDLHVLYGFVRNAQRHVAGRKVIVTHGPELRAFAKENYETYQPVVDRMAELARDGIEFRMCNDALRAAGYEPDDMHGFVRVISSGFPEIAHLLGQGFRYVNPLPLRVDGLREREQAR